MREIKFRGWHTGANKMFSPEEMAEDQLTIMTTGSFINVSGSNTSLSVIYGRDKFIPLQFTGLKDKNGKEIYEGDVLAIFDRNGDGDYDEDSNMYHPERETSIVKWDSAGGFTLEWDYGDYDFTLLGWAIKHHDLEVEVFGNIYENPELLKA